MSRTLFLYIFKDLLKFFLLAAAGLAAIMSFGGLLKPLTKQGLDIGQVGSMLSYMMPAMTTYSLPIAALFATTMVYGRLTADNELTACRAGGISWLGIASPAVLLGLVVAIFSLLFLCFIVPFFTLQVERVIYSNIAQLVANRIERTNEISFDGFTIYADAADLPPAPPDDPALQIVRLINPTVVTLNRPSDEDPFLRKPKEFFTAREAIAYFRESPDGDAMLEVELIGGAQFPRELASGTQVTVGVTRFGPVPIESQIRENPKFMNINQLKAMLVNPARSNDVADILRQGVREHQTAVYAGAIVTRLNGPSRSFTFQSGDERTTIVAGDEPAEVDGSHIVIRYGPDPQVVGFTEINGASTLIGRAEEIRIGVRPSYDGEAFDVDLELRNATIQAGADVTARSSFPRSMRVPMPASIRQIDRPLTGGKLLEDLQHKLARLKNEIWAEIHARISFGFSCLVLVVVGCALGILFRSGNFLSAFAVSVIPAVLCVALIVTGQHIGEGLPRNIAEAGKNLRLGVAFIYSGNVVIAVIAGALFLRLRRQ